MNEGDANKKKFKRSVLSEMKDESKKKKNHFQKQYLLMANGKELTFFIQNLSRFFFTHFSFLPLLNMNIFNDLVDGRFNKMICGRD